VTRAAPTQPALVLLLQRATHAVGVQLEARLAAAGVSQGEAHVLALLADGQEHAVGELQRGLNHRPSTLSGILDRLEGRGLVTRTLNDADRRSLLVALTRTGRETARAVVEALRAVEAAAGRRVSARDLAGFRAVVTALGDPQV
jgi:MarR family transcriptional regulator, organic hydroperoxide resistance regulator